MHFEEITKIIAKHLTQNPICVETGTPYGFPPNDPYWNTSSAIVKRICEPLNGHLYSIDLLDRSEVIKNLFSLGNLDLEKITLLVGNSPDIMKNLSVDRIDLLCLDSGEDEDLLVNEFKAVQHLLSIRHYILVDDIYNQNSVKYKKIVPLLKEMGYDWKECPTETGCFFASKGYLLE